MTTTIENGSDIFSNIVQYKLESVQKIRNHIIYAILVVTKTRKCLIRAESALARDLRAMQSSELAPVIS